MTKVGATPSRPTDHAPPLAEALREIKKMGTSAEEPTALELLMSSRASEALRQYEGE